MSGLDRLPPILRHGPAFWRLLASYPRLERARGFLDGLAHAEGLEPLEESEAEGEPGG